MYNLIFLFVLLISFSTGFSQTHQFHEKFVKGDFAGALTVLEKDKKILKEKNRLLFNLQRGLVLQMLGEFEKSNLSFEEAHIYIEDYRKSISQEVVASITSPGTKPYKGEDFEIVLIHYYKAINYLQMKKFDEALVECRRINNKLNELNDKYEYKKNRYKRDAFVENLTGIIYEAKGDINNAFIAYRNSYATYTQDYSQNFNTPPPNQLKKDLLRTAHLMGFGEELEKYEKLTGLKYKDEQPVEGQLLFFWNNGLAPVKDQWAITFFIVRGVGGAVSFVNEDLGLVIPFPAGGGNDQLQFSDLRFVRIAFPKYVERKPYYREAELFVNNRKYPIELAENINEIAFKSLEDRMLRELSQGLLRLAVKQGSEALLRQTNQNLGTLLSITNALTEKADTRNWQTLPYSISYARVPLVVGENTVKFKTYSPLKSRENEKDFKLMAEKGEIVFMLHPTLLSIPISP